MILEQIVLRWQGFRRALRSGDREAFDSLMGKARRHSAAGGYNIMPDPIESMFISMLLEHEKDIRDLKREAGGGQSGQNAGSGGGDSSGSAGGFGARQRGGGG